MQEIPGWKGYFVSPDGKVYTNRKSPLNRKGELRELSSSNNKGYMQIQLWNSGKRKPFSVHRLVAEAFIPNPDNLPQVNHINEDKSDNHVDNLEWCNNQQNTEYSCSKLYIIENKNGDKFEVFNLTKWCEENNLKKQSLYQTYTKAKRNWHKNYKVVSIRELTTEERLERRS